MEFVVREMEPGDEPLVYSSWSRCARKTPPTSWVPWPIFDGHIRRRLGSGTTLVACHPDDPSMAIGFVCFERAGGTLVVHWVYVVSMFRRMGVASGLVRQLPHETIVATSTSKHFCEWLRKKTGAVYDPYFGG